MEPIDIFNEFKRLYPNSNEVFNFNNVPRYEWSIKQAKLKPLHEYLTVKVPDNYKALQSIRRVHNFDEFPAMTQRVYLGIADYYAGTQVFATGSRVDGSFIELSSSDEIRKLREYLGKSDKIVSDYDYTMHGGKIPDVDGCKQFIQKFFFAVADAVPFGLQEQKVKIPMWDFDKMTDADKAQARALFEAQRWGALMQLHNRLQLSPNNYCCSEAPIIKWFTWAYNNGKI